MAKNDNQLVNPAAMPQGISLLQCRIESNNRLSQSLDSGFHVLITILRSRSGCASWKSCWDTL